MSACPQILRALLSLALVPSCLSVGIGLGKKFGPVSSAFFPPSDVVAAPHVSHLRYLSDHEQRYRDPRYSNEPEVDLEQLEEQEEQEGPRELPVKTYPDSHLRQAFLAF